VEEKYVPVGKMRAAEVRAERDLVFTIKCKNTGEVHFYNLANREYTKKFPEITSIAAWALYKIRETHGHLARQSIFDVLTKFFMMLERMALYKPDEMDRSVLSCFAEWLKKDKAISYSTAASMYRKISPLFKQMNRHALIVNDFIPVKNAFPRSSELTTALSGYDQNEIRSILNAAVKGMRSSAARLEKKYQPAWLGKPAPLDDVACVGRRGQRSIWATEKYIVWWWENHCESRCLTARELFKMPQGQCFYNALSPTGIGSNRSLADFYNRLGAGPAYIPTYKGQDCPVKYRTPWKKKDYVVWYWENHLNCLPLSGDEAKVVSPEFHSAIKEYFGGKFQEFFESIGVTRWLHSSDLIPYYLMLLIRTQLNPSTIQRLTTACLIKDPLDDEKMSIDWTKLRSFKSGLTIPSDRTNNGWPVMLIRRVLEVTQFIRADGQVDLWIINTNPERITKAIGNTTFKKGLKEFSLRHGLRHSDGTPLIIQGRLIRPTMAWGEYLRTEDMNYLQTLLGHARMSTTADYLRRRTDPVFLSRRGVHQEIMFQGLMVGGEITQPYIDATKSVEVVEVQDVLHNHCKDPLSSPVAGQRKGAHCTQKHEVCLGCPNIIITHEDIKKYFCFVEFNNYLLKVGDISQQEYDRAVMEKTYIWSEYILPKYDSNIVEQISLDSKSFPLPLWDIAIYEREKV
jgi:hypothetical protein